MPDLGQLNIELSSSNSPLRRALGALVRIDREMVVGFDPWADRERFYQSLREEDKIIATRRRTG